MPLSKFVQKEIRAAREGKKRKLDLKYSELTALEKGIFDGLDALKVLVLGGDRLGTLEKGIFDGLRSLETLNIRYNKLSTLDKGIFDGMRSLERLDLTGNRLSTLDKGIFDGLSKLRILYLDDNQLSTLDKRIFDGLNKLQTLFLGDNELGTLEKGIFDGLRSLETLNIRLNKLSTLEKGIFDGLSELRILYLGSNELSTLEKGIFDGLSKLQMLYLCNNELGTLEKGIFDGLSALERLDLGSNELGTLEKGIFDGLSALETLDLTANKLSTLEKGIFDGLSALETLDLRYNKLTRLEKGIFDGMSALRKLYLQGNQLGQAGDKFSELIDSLSSLESLTTLNIKGNGFSDSQLKQINTFIEGNFTLTVVGADKLSEAAKKSLIRNKQLNIVEKISNAEDSIKSVSPHYKKGSELLEKFNRFAVALPAKRKNLSGEEKLLEEINTLYQDDADLLQNHVAELTETIEQLNTYKSEAAKIQQLRLKRVLGDTALALCDCVQVMNEKGVIEKEVDVLTAFMKLVPETHPKFADTRIRMFLEVQMQSESIIEALPCCLNDAGEFIQFDAPPSTAQYNIDKHIIKSCFARDRKYDWPQLVIETSAERSKYLQFVMLKYFKAMKRGQESDDKLLLERLSNVPDNIFDISDEDIASLFNDCTDPQKKIISSLENQEVILTLCDAIKGLGSELSEKELHRFSPPGLR